MKLIQSQVQHLSQQQLQSFELLQMSSLELDTYLRELAQENPVMELDDQDTQPQPQSERDPDRDLLRNLRWLEDNDYQNRYYRSTEEEFDPLSRVGTAGGLEETLERFLLRQLDPMDQANKAVEAARYLAGCLDEGGYFRLNLSDLAAQTGMPVHYWATGLQLLRSLEPAGVGASTLSECLELQLLRIGYEGPALDIVREHLDLLAKHHHRAIASRLGIQPQDVQAAEAVIRELEPRPGLVFEQVGQIHYVQPDLFVVEECGCFVPLLPQKSRPPFQVNQYYQSLLSQTEDPEVREYLQSKIRQAETLLFALSQRESTLERCAKAIVAHQQDFFRFGAQSLLPLRLTDIAQELDVHESTVSRAIREKYLQCAQGTYPLRYFFSRNVSGTEPVSGAPAGVGAAAARIMLAELIEQEDKSYPLSDQQICQELAKKGCALSRRTVAKYREELNIPSTYGRKKAK